MTTRRSFVKSLLSIPAALSLGKLVADPVNVQIIIPTSVNADRIRQKSTANFTKLFLQHVSAQPVRSVGDYSGEAGFHFLDDGTFNGVYKNKLQQVGLVYGTKRCARVFKLKIRVEASEAEMDAIIQSHTFLNQVRVEIEALAKARGNRVIVITGTEAVHNFNYNLEPVYWICARLILV